MDLPKQSKLSLSLQNIPRGIGIGISGVIYQINERIQDLKENWYKFQDEEYTRIERGELNPDSYFSNLTICKRK